MGNKAAAMRSRRRSRSDRRRARVAVAGLGIAVAGWAAWSVFQGLQGPDQAQLERSGSIGTQVGELAPDFSVPTLAGDSFSLSAQRGRPTVIYIMAYWCATCIPEARALAQIHQEYGEAVSILALDIDPSSTTEALAQFKQAVGNPDYAWGFDVEQEVVRTYQVPSLDATIILDPEGYVVYRDPYSTPYATLIEALRPYLPES